MGRQLAIYGTVLAVLLVLDGAWLTLVAGPMFKATLGDLLLPKFRIAPAVAFYLLYAAGIAVFVLPRADTIGEAVLFGALFGLVAYGTYDLTNDATLKAWTVKLLATDMGWGMVQTAAASVVARLIFR